MDELGKVIDPRTVRFERPLPGPIERVWAYLTEPEKRAKWFAGGGMELREGGRAHFHFRHSNLSSEKVAPEKYRTEGTDCVHDFDVTVTRCEPPHLLTFTWPEEDGQVSDVTFELTVQGNDVLLVLTHRNIGTRKAMANFSGGWHSHLGILSDVLHEREPRPFWTMHASVEAEYAKRLAG